MRAIHLASAAVALFVCGGCADGRGSGGPTDPELALHPRATPTPAMAAPPTEASGTFQALVDFSTLTLTPRGSNCVLRVSGQLVFEGTLEGIAMATTTALTHASCADVLANPPGTFPDVFRSEASFAGTVDGEPVEARMVYQGRAHAGGEIDARLLLSGGVRGVLQVDGRVAVGGAYEGSVLVR